VHGDVSGQRTQNKYVNYNNAAKYSYIQRKTCARTKRMYSEQIIHRENNSQQKNNENRRTVIESTEAQPCTFDKCSYYCTTNMTKRTVADN